MPPQTWLASRKDQSPSHGVAFQMWKPKSRSEVNPILTYSHWFFLLCKRVAVFNIEDSDLFIALACWLQWREFSHLSAANNILFNIISSHQILYHRICLAWGVVWRYWFFNVWYKLFNTPKGLTPRNNRFVSAPPQVAPLRGDRWDHYPLRCHPLCYGLLQHLFIGDNEGTGPGSFSKLSKLCQLWDSCP